MPDRWERIEAEVREALGGEASVWDMGRSRWLDATTLTEGERRRERSIRKELLRKRRLLLAR